MQLNRLSLFGAVSGRIGNTTTALFISLISLALVAGTIVVYITGGTAYVYPYVMLVPVLLAAAWLGTTGAVITAVAAALLIGPYMPLDVEAGVYQTTQNWLLRMVAFAGLGGVTGILFGRLRGEYRAHMNAARTDPRTGLANQVALEEDFRARGRNSWTRRRSGLGMMLIRVTDLAEALEAVGPDSADEIMANLAHRIQGALPATGRIYRFSASELAMLAAEVDAQRMASHARRIQEVAETALRVRDIPIRLELVMGIAVIGEAEHSQCTPFEFFRRARLALFEAIGNQEDHSVYCPEFERDRAQSLTLITQLRPGLQAGEFELHYQPKHRFATNGDSGGIDGCEALIRWNHPDGMVSPGAFIPKVERTRLINPVTRFVIRESIAFARKHPGLRVGFNLSPRSLYDRRMMEHLVAALRNANLDGGTIEVEITETGIMRDPHVARAAMSRIRDAGARVSIDDFGTGHSSFAWLRELPIDGFKIDRAFIQDLDKDRQLRDIVRCMIDVGHALDLEVTGEGAETPGECRVLQQQSCDQLQGFFLARPMPADAFDTWLEDRANSGVDLLQLESGHIAST